MILLFFIGCRTAGEMHPPEAPPDWVTGEPKVEGMICAVGMSEPTFYKDEGRIYAAEDARKELAKSIRVQILSIMVDISTDKGTSVDESTVTEVSSWVTSAVVENSQIRGYWFDAWGIVSHRTNITYVLCCMPRKFKREGLAKIMEGSYQSEKVRPEDIGRTADEIIDKLLEER